MGPMSIEARGHLGHNGHLGQMETRKNMHQDKWVITANGRWEHIGIWDNWALRVC